MFHVFMYIFIFHRVQDLVFTDYKCPDDRESALFMFSSLQVSSLHTQIMAHSRVLGTLRMKGALY